MKFQIFSLLDFIPRFHNEDTFLQQAGDVLVEAEQLGFDGVWTGEEHFYTFGLCPNPHVFLSWIASRTSTFKLGTAVSLLSLDHPLRKAEDFAMLDVLSNGRLRFGVGRGGIPAHFPPFQIDPLEAEARTLESLEIIRRSWTNESISYDGKFWQIPECKLSPKPRQKPVPIYQGTMSLGGFERAAKAGDGVFLTLVPGQEQNVRDMLDSYRKILVETGQVDTAPPPMCNLHLYLHEDRAVAHAEAEEHMDRYASHILTMGFPGLDLHTAKMRDDIARFLPKKDQALVGTPDDVCNQIHQLRDMFGLDNLGINIQAGGRAFHRVHEQMQLFAREVMPEFSGQPSADPLNLLVQS